MAATDDVGHAELVESSKHPDEVLAVRFNGVIGSRIAVESHVVEGHSLVSKLVDGRARARRGLDDDKSLPAQFDSA